MIGLIIYLVGVLMAVYGVAKQVDSPWDGTDGKIATVISVAMWPILVGIGLISAPFRFVFRLGRNSRQKHITHSTAEKR